MISRLGSMPFSEEYLAEDTVGRWVIEKAPGKEPRMYVDDVMLGLIGLTEQIGPEDTFKAWLAGIDVNYLDSVLETERMNTAGIRAEVVYPWHYPDGHTILIRCEGIRNNSYTDGIRTEGRHRNITNLVRLQKEAAVISALSGDFECVNYVLLHNGPEDDVTIPFRASDRIRGLIPGWEQETSFHNRLELLIHHVGNVDDMLNFRAQTRRNVIIGHLQHESAYYVNFRAVFSDGVQYYQMKFTADRDEGGRLIGIVVGIHSIDDEMRQELRIREKTEKLIEEKTQELKKKNEALSKVSSRIIEVVGNIVENRDEDSGKHVNRVKYLTRALAMQVMKDLPEYGLTVEDVSDIATLSPLHDVGKIKIPDSILLKPGRLTAEEFEVMKTHCDKGCEILEGMADGWSLKMYRLGRDICRYHHEKWDGRGYPCGLKGDEIPIAAQIVSIADVYDALVTERCYKAAYSHDEAFRMIIDGECGKFSEKLLRCFSKCREAFSSSSAYMSEEDVSPDSRDQSSRAEGEYISEAVLLLERISESMPGGFFIYQADEDEKLLYFNEMMMDFLGCGSREEFIEYTGNSFKGIVHPEDYEDTVSDINYQIQKDNLDHIVYRVIRKDGSIRWIDDYGKFIRSEDLGDVFFVFANDITDAYERRVSEASHTKRNASEPEDIRGVLNGLKVLSVDDSDFTRDIHRDLLEEEGAIVTDAVNGLEAVELIRQSMDYDLILMDLVMPVMSGISAVREIRRMLDEAGRNITIICVTAQGTDMQVGEAIEAGAYECMYKPLNIRELARHIIASIRENSLRMEQLLEHTRMIAVTDSLTHVKNIAAFTDKTAELAAKLKDNAEFRFGVVMCDCDRLKSVNDSYGHDAGDKYICNTSAAICETFKKSPVFRIGGDEFVVILEGADLNNADALLEALKSRQKGSDGLFDIDAGYSNFSIGTAFYDRKIDETIGNVFKRADAEMYKNKLSKY